MLKFKKEIKQEKKKKEKGETPRPVGREGRLEEEENTIGEDMGLQNVIGVREHSCWKKKEMIAFMFHCEVNSWNL